MKRLSALVCIFTAALAACRSRADPSAEQTVHRQPAVREGYFTSHETVRIFYRVVGAGADTVVAVHGGPGVDMNTIVPSFDPLAERHVLIYYDQRGGGRSTLPDDTTLLDARYFVEDLEALRRHFDLARLQILAHSFGPVLVALYARTYPDHVARMIFTGAIAPSRALSRQYVRATYESLDSAARARQAELIDSVETAADPVPFCRALEGRESADTAGPKATMCAAPPEAIRYRMRYTRRITFQSLGDWDFTSSLAQVSAPLLVIHGENDPSGIESARSWAAAVPNGRVWVVPDAGHGPQNERPDLVFPAIDEFLAGRWPEGAERPRLEKLGDR